MKLCIIGMKDACSKQVTTAAAVQTTHADYNLANCIALATHLTDAVPALLLAPAKRYQHLEYNFTLKVFRL
jgi:hypothetical protein